MFYIQEADKPNFIFNFFNIIQLKEDNIILPIADEKITLKKAKKLAQKTKKIMDEAISKKVVISKKIKKQEDYINLLHTYDLKIVDGKWLFEILACKILDYISSQMSLKKEEILVSVLVNDLDEIIFESIKKMAKEYKRVNIITNHIERFKNIEKQFLEKDGIMITVGNNKKKGLAKSKLILNVDFPSELINQYNIYDEAIIVSIKHKVKITKKRYNGRIFNDYEISFDQFSDFDYDKIDKYKQCDIYEAKMNKKQPVKEIWQKIENLRLPFIYV